MRFFVCHLFVSLNRPLGEEGHVSAWHESRKNAQTVLASVLLRGAVRRAAVALRRFTVVLGLWGDRFHELALLVQNKHVWNQWNTCIRAIGSDRILQDNSGDLNFKWV